MKKILNKLFTGSLLACMVLVSSCAGDYLDTAPTDSTGASDAVGTTANAMKALNGIAKIMTTQQYYFGQGFAGETTSWLIMKTIRARITYIICMLPDGHLSIIKNSIHALTLFMMHTHGTTIILSLVMRTLFLPILIMPKDFKLKRFCQGFSTDFPCIRFRKVSALLLLAMAGFQ